MTERSDSDSGYKRFNGGSTAVEVAPGDKATQLLYHGHLLDKAASMRPMQTTACRLAAVMADPDCSIEDVSKEIRPDPPLVAALLKEANSAASAPLNGISSIQGAVTRLGFARVLAIAAGSMLGSTAQRPLEAYQLGPGGLWDHSVLASYVAETIYRMGKPGIGPEVVTSALLHHVGQIILNDILEPTHFQSAIRINLTSDAAERELVDVDHAEMGAALLEMWNLPASITDPIRFHHAPHWNTFPAAQVVNIASTIGAELGGYSQTSGLELADPLLEPSLEALNLERATVVEGAVALLALAGRTSENA